MDMEREVLTRIAERFQVTVPAEFRDLFDLRIGDLFDWRFDEPSGEIRLLAKRAQLITPQLREKVRGVRARQADAKHREEEEARHDVESIARP
jgi:bifunctional DNA-binding transcriptional regulator/antitoxin component of YhaV-PrlF toxin-antitoxin module